MADEVLCLDTGVWIKFLVPEEPPQQREAARRLVLRGLTKERFVAPAFAWAEVGTVLRKKVRQGVLSPTDAQAAWLRFRLLPIEYLDDRMLRARAWEFAEQYGLLTLYDAAFLACAELCPADEPAVREFWTADQKLLGHLGAQRPGYVQAL